MCYYVDNNFTKTEIAKTFKVGLDPVLKFNKESQFSAFKHENTAIITDEDPTLVSLGKWGLMPSWAKEDFWKQTLNAKIETITELNSFKNAHQNRCVLLCKGFYEWKWLDGKGKNKEKFKIFTENSDVFSLGAIYEIYQNEITFSVVTTEANDLMKEIHNIKKRMPIILENGMERDWLTNLDINQFSYQNYSPKLRAENLSANLPRIGNLF